MSRVEETKQLINSLVRLHRRGSEYSALLDIESLLGNIALSLAELNDRLGKREDGHISNE